MSEHEPEERETLDAARDAAIRGLECVQCLQGWLLDDDVDDAEAMTKADEAAIDTANAYREWLANVNEQTLRRLRMIHEPAGAQYRLGEHEFVTAHDFIFELLRRADRLSDAEWPPEHWLPSDRRAAASDSLQSIPEVDAEQLAETIERERLRGLQPSLPLPQPMRVEHQRLDDTERLILRELLSAAATSQDRRLPADDLATRLNLDADTEFKRHCSTLVKLGLTDSKSGRGGGAWLTARGKSVATSL